MVNLKKLNKFELGEILIPEKIYKLNYKKELENIYVKLKFDNLNYLIITNIFFFSIIISLIIYILLFPNFYVWFNDYFESGFVWKFIVVFLLYFSINLIFYYSFLIGYFIYLTSNFTKNQVAIEKDLPEFLDNLVSNLKGGISLEKALLKSVRKEQKELLKEVTLINEKILMGLSVLDALDEFRNRYKNSAVISRTFFLVEEGIKGGGNLSEPLEKISKNLKKIYMLNDEIKANAGGFSVVISVISMIVAPLLFALAITLLNFIGNLFALLSQSGTDFLSVSSVPPEFSEYLILFSYAMIILITVFSSLITSQLKNEETYEAMKYIPIYIMVSLFLYWEFSSLLLSFFSNIF